MANEDPRLEKLRNEGFLGALNKFDSAKAIRVQADRSKQHHETVLKEMKRIERKAEEF